MGRYYELEEPTVIKSNKNVVKIYMKYGKVQVFPRVENTKYGIGKGATVDLESMDLKDLLHLRELFNKAIDFQIKGGILENEFKHQIN